MPQPSIEKLELILAADPRSRVFVELARLLLEKGDFARAMEICRKGLENHPDSIFARVLWGRALLATGSAEEAVSQFEIAIAIDPANPYAYNLTGEALFEAGLFKPALPILARAVQLQPGDERIHHWLSEAKRCVNDPGAAPEPRSVGPSGAAAPAKQDQDVPDSLSLTSDPDSSDLPPIPGAPAERRPQPPPPLRKPGPPGAGLGQPPPLPPGALPKPPPLRSSNPRLAALSALPEAEEPRMAPPASEPVPDAAEAERIAKTYEHELRQRLKQSEKPPGFFKRHLGPVLASLLLVILVVGGGGTYRLVRLRNRAKEVRVEVEAARKGLARDTVGALREAAQVLQDARDLDPANGPALSLSAQVAALLWADHDDSESKELAEKLATSSRAGEGWLVARWLLARGEAARAEAASALADAPDRAGPLVQESAGRIWLARGQAEKALARFTSAAQSTPPFLRALADIGDFQREQGDLEAALETYRTALAAHPTHPRSVIGAAEVRLQLHRDIPESIEQLKAVDADAGSAPAVADRLRFELVYARCLAAVGKRADAVDRIDRATERFSNRRAELAAARAEIYLTTGAFDRAESEASRAVALAPQDPIFPLLLARAQLARGRYQELLRATEKSRGRQIHLFRAMARYELADFNGARAELEQTRHDSKMSAEAAAYYALVDQAAGRTVQAKDLAEKLTNTRNPPLMAFITLGRIDLAAGNAAGAEKQYRAAVQRDGNDVEAQCALGRFLLGQGKAAAALEPLESATRLDPFHFEARRALGQARLAIGNAAGARDEFEAVLKDLRDAESQRGLSAAHLALKMPADAQRDADRAIDLDRGNPASYAAAIRAARARSDAKAARRYAAVGYKVTKGKIPESMKQLFADAAHGR
jgi:tetratricopeptide (TPR) repeat protein